jgi:hypothetical protein
MLFRSGIRAFSRQANVGRNTAVIRGKATTSSAGAQNNNAVQNQPKGWAVWMYEVWPILAVTAVTGGYGVYTMWVNMHSPSYKFNADERRTMDYIENNKDPQKAIEWANHPLEKGPEIVHKTMPYKRTEDYKP